MYINKFHDNKKKKKNKATLKRYVLRQDLKVKIEFNIAQACRESVPEYRRIYTTRSITKRFFSVFDF